MERKDSAPPGSTIECIPDRTMESTAIFRKRQQHYCCSQLSVVDWIPWAWRAGRKRVVHRRPSFAMKHCCKLRMIRMIPQLMLQKMLRQTPSFHDLDQRSALLRPPDRPPFHCHHQHPRPSKTPASKYHTSSAPHEPCSIPNASRAPSSARSNACDSIPSPPTVERETCR